MNRGKLVILLMLVAGCVMGRLAVIFHHSLSRQAIAWWGTDDVEMIRNAPRVEALKLAASDRNASGDVVTIGSVSYSVVERRDVSGVHGIDHIRHALLEDAHFHWGDQPADHASPKWLFGLNLVTDSRQLTVVFDGGGHVGRSDRGDWLTLTPIATGWSEFFAEQFGPISGDASRK